MERNKNIHIHDSGLVVNPSYSFLGAFSDGKVRDNGITGILEVKCPCSARDMLLSDAVNMIPKFCLDTNMHLKNNHEYYFQIQGQLLVTGAPFCDFVVYTTTDFSVQRILPDEVKCHEMLTKLADFYYNYAAPFLFPKAKDT